MGLEKNQEEKIDFTGEYNKKKKIIIISSAVLLLLLGFGLAYAKFTSKPQESQTPEEKAEPEEVSEQQEPEEVEEDLEPKEVLAASYLTGELIEPDLAKSRPLAIIVENHSSSRPPTGLIEADIVYEVPVEAGITRFMAIYQQNTPEKVGPERSTRVYFLDWVKEYNAVHAHIGQDPLVLTLIRPYEIDNLRDTGAWWDPESTGRSREHRAYTSVVKLREAMANNNWEFVEDLTSWVYSSQASELASRPEAQYVHINYSNDQYKVVWHYNQEDNKYYRYQHQTPHMDASNDQQLHAANLVIQHLSIWPRRGDDKGRKDMQVIGEGDLMVFRDGELVRGRWHKESRESRTRLVDESGQDIQLRPGKTWVQIVPSFENTVNWETIESGNDSLNM